MVGLFGTQVGFVPPGTLLCLAIDLMQGGAAIDFWFACTQQIQVRPVQQQNLFGHGRTSPRGILHSEQVVKLAAYDRPHWEHWRRAVPIADFSVVKAMSRSNPAETKS